MKAIDTNEWAYYDGHFCIKTAYDGYYASIYGKIITIKIKGGQGSMDFYHPREMSYKVDKDGYLEVCLSIVDEFGQHKRIYRRVHRLIWETFNGPIPDGLTIDHIDSNKQNNCLSNLRLLTREENASIANKNKPSPHRYIYELSKNGVLIGTYDRKQLNAMFGVSNKVWYKDFVSYFSNLGYSIKLLGSVEDIERVNYY